MFRVFRAGWPLFKTQRNGNIVVNNSVEMIMYMFYSSIVHSLDVHIFGMIQVMFTPCIMIHVILYYGECCFRKQPDIFLLRLHHLFRYLHFC